MYELKVEGMSCGHCVKAVTNAVLQVDSAAKVDVDLSSKTVRVESAVALDAIKGAVAEAGYQILASSPG